MIISIVGLGFVGTAIKECLVKKNILEIIIYDKYKNNGIGSIDDCLKSDIMFLCLPTVYDISTKEYDLKPIIENLNILNEKNYKGIVVIKSTLMPGTTQNLQIKYSNLNLCHNPEFLSAKTAREDFMNQKHIILGKTDNKKLNNLFNFYKKYWPVAEISISSSDESEAAKLGCNCFYSVKIQFFNELFMMCKKQNMDFIRVRDMMLKNEWINPMHTKVPGTDGKLSYGGLCFPKDTNALSSHLNNLSIPGKVLDATIEERNLMRDDNFNINFSLKNNLYLE